MGFKGPPTRGGGLPPKEAHEPAPSETGETSRRVGGPLWQSPEPQCSPHPPHSHSQQEINTDPKRFKHNWRRWGAGVDANWSQSKEVGPRPLGWRPGGQHSARKGGPAPSEA